MTPAQLLRIMPAAKRQADVFAPLLAEAMEKYQINTLSRRASFLAQIGVESGQLTRLVENLNYSAERMRVVWPTRFPSLAQTIGYAGNATELANKVYANRMGNGDEKSGDGWKYRGRGLIHLTGRDNYKRLSDATGYDFVAEPQMLEAPRMAALSAAWFWSVNGLNALADTGNQTAVTKKINGGVHGLAQRLEMFEVAKRVLS